MASTVHDGIPTAPAPPPDRGPIGGQALLEGVMMRRGEGWAAAVRRPDGSIATTSRALPSGLARWRRVPLVRGILALAESAGLGTRAMLWAAGERGDPDDGTGGYSRTGLAVSTVLAVVLALGLFAVFPAAAARGLGIDHHVLFNVIEGGIRLAVLVAYLWLLGRSSEVQRVFGYHGAEHMAIHAFEHGHDLDPAIVGLHDRRHPRCGTSFMALVVLVTVVAHILVATPSWASLVASRILLLPLVAAVSYEGIRFAGRHQERWYGRALMRPGYWLQGITTREPGNDQIEVAIAALQATLVSETPVVASASPVRAEVAT